MASQTVDKDRRVEERREICRDCKEQCGEHHLLDQEFRHELEKVFNEISVLCQWKIDHEEFKEGSLEETRKEFHVIEKKLHRLELENSGKLSQLKEWLQTRTIAILITLVFNLVGVITALALIVIRT